MTEWSGHRYEPTRGLALWGDEEEEAARKVVRARSPFRYYGPDLLHETDRFERTLAAQLDVDHVVAVSSGTAALACALVGMGMPAGAEVIVPAVTFVGCVNAIAWARGVPVLAEIDDTLTLDPKRLEEVVTERTFAVMPVHLANIAADMTPLLEVARRHGLRVLEDGAQALGVRYHGRRAGSLGDGGAFSFQLEKNITAGEGGAVSTSDSAVFDRVVRYQDQGGQFTTSHGEVRGARSQDPFLGVNLRMNELTAAILNVQLSRLDSMLDRLRGIARHVRSDLESTIPQWRRIPDEEGSGGDLTALFSSRAEAKRVVASLTRAGVPAKTLYQGQCVYSNPAVKAGRTGWGHELGPQARLHGSEQLVGRSVTIDLGAAMTDSDVDWLVDTVRRVAVTQR